MNPSQNERALLFTPTRLRSVVARNRIVASPMCQCVSSDGEPNDWQLALRARETQRRKLVRGADTTIPFGLNDDVTYSSTLRRAERRSLG